MIKLRGAGNANVEELSRNCGALTFEVSPGGIFSQLIGHGSGGRVRQVARTDSMHMILNFQVNQHMFYALATGDARPLGRALSGTRCRNELSQWGVSLRSHDELDLGRLEKKHQRSR